jgi:hypothetical protein
MSGDGWRNSPRVNLKTGDRGLLYKLARAKLGVSQGAMATILGLSRGNLIQKECFKRVYTAEELSILRELSGLTWQELGDLIDSIKVSD